MTEQHRAVLYALTAVLFWSTVATAFKLSLQYLSTIELLLYSTFFSTAVLAVILIQQGKFQQVFKSTKQDFLLSIVLGFLSPFLYYLILFEAYERLPAQQAQPINYTWAIMLSLLSVPLLKHKISRNQWLALIISYLGVVVISTEGKLLQLNFTDSFGVILALVSTVIWSLYWIFNTRDHRDPVVGLFINFICSLPFMLIYYFVMETPRIIPIEGILGAAYVGLFEMGICFVLWLLAMKLTDNTASISNLIFLSPFLSLVFIHFILAENIVPSTFIGLVLIVGGLLVQRYNPKKSVKPR